MWSIASESPLPRWKLSDCGATYSKLNGMKKQVFAKLRQLGLFARAVRLWSREGVDREMNEFIRGERTSYEGCPTFNLEEDVEVEENQEVVVENQEEVVVDNEVVEEKEDRAWWVNRSEVLGLRSRFAPNYHVFHIPTLPPCPSPLSQPPPSPSLVLPPQYTPFNTFGRLEVPPPTFLKQRK